MLSCVLTCNRLGILQILLFFTGEIPKEIVVSVVNPKNKEIKWLIKQYVSDKKLEFNQNLMKFKPQSEEEITSWAPKILIDLPLTLKEYGKEIPQINNKNNTHLLYSDISKNRKIEIYVLDAAKNPETMLQVQMAYDMEAEFGKAKSKPYIANYDESTKTSKLLYKINDRLVLRAIGQNLMPEELWKYIKALDLRF